MNRFLNKLERKYGRYAIQGLINYLMVLYTIGMVIGLMFPTFYYRFLALDFDAIFHGQVWRLVTFVMEPYGSGSSITGFVEIIFFFFKVSIFLMIGRSLESVWGTFRFNLYFLTGYLLNIIAGLIMYAFHTPFYVGLEYIYQAMFFTFALLFPDVQFMLYMILPIKVKWLALLDAVILIRSLILFWLAGYYHIAAAIIVAFANFLFYFFATRDYKKISPRQVRKQAKRRRNYKKKMAKSATGSRHKCAICGRTELDNDKLEFRYCSKCEGNYEYCSDHLFSHQHVKKFL